MSEQIPQAGFTELDSYGEGFSSRVNMLRFHVKFVRSVLGNAFREATLELPKAVLHGRHHTQAYELEFVARQQHTLQKIGDWAVKKEVFSPQAQQNWLLSSGLDPEVLSG